MKSELKTLDVIDVLRTLHQNYIKLLNDNREDSSKLTYYKQLAEGVANSINEIEIMANMIHSDK